MKRTIKLKKNFEFQNAFKRGKFVGGNFLDCFYLKNNKNINYIGIAISSKLCNAVKRNRIKRIIREAYQRLENSIQQGTTFVFLWKKKKDIAECTFQNVKDDMMMIFKKIGIYINEKHND